MKSERAIQAGAKQARAKVNLVWFRQDLRLADHRPLTEALRGASSVLAVFVLDESASGPWHAGAAALWWLHHSLNSLAASLRQAGAHLVLRRGDAERIIPQLAREAAVSDVHCGASHEPWLRALDRSVAAALEKDGIGFHAHRVSTLFELDDIRTKTGGIYGVYTPFARACRSLPDPEPPLPAPKHVPGLDRDFKSETLPDWRLLPTKPDWAGGLRDTWMQGKAGIHGEVGEPGEAGGHRRMQTFLAGHLAVYADNRNLPANEQGTSMLSPHLRWGEISPVQVWHAARAASAHAGKARLGFETFQGELLWHEFAAYLLANHPDMPSLPLRGAFANLPWRKDAKGLHAWQQGQTGVPIVDAGMRQLWHTGWMHNRVRMITASFLCKHLLIPWQQGEEWFWDTLVDGDLATNAASWQWVAGCGTDSQPFFRIFNPVLQSRKFDPDGVYIRRWVPELAGLPDRDLHAPWDAPPMTLAQAGIRLGKHYPHPIVSLEEGRDRALAAFRDSVREPAPAS